MNKVAIYFRYFTKEKGWQNKKMMHQTSYKRNCKGLRNEIKSVLFWHGYRNTIDSNISDIKFKFIR